MEHLALKRWLWLVGIWFLWGCSAPPKPTLAPTTQPMMVAYPPSLRPAIEILGRCASRHPGLSLYPMEVSPHGVDLREADLLLGLGAVPPGMFAAQIGWEMVLPVVHADRPLQRLSAEALRAIFSGRQTTWEGGQPLTVWSYPPGNDLRSIWDAAILLGSELSPEAHLAPDPQAMIIAIAADPLAVGYLPQSWLPTSGVRSIAVDEKLAENLRQPVLLLSWQEPQGEVRSFVVCVQQSAAEFSPE